MSALSVTVYDWVFDCAASPEGFLPAGGGKEIAELHHAVSFPMRVLIAVCGAPSGRANQKTPFLTEFFACFSFTKTVRARTWDTQSVFDPKTSD